MINVLLAYNDELNTIVEEFKSTILGNNGEENCIKFERADENTSVSDYSKILIFIDDDKSILDTYYRIYTEAEKSGNVDKIVVYYKDRSEYATKEVYYAKKDLNKNKLLRFLDFRDVWDIVFDFASSLYCDKLLSVDIKRGKLFIGGRETASLFDVKLIQENDLISGNISRIESAERTLGDVKSKELFDKKYIDELTEIAKNIDGMYRELDRLLIYAFELYVESLRAFLNSDIQIIDYIFLKEYIMTGQFGSVQGVFVTRRFISLFDAVNKENADNVLNCLKMYALSLAFKDDNTFTARGLNNAFELGKKIEKEFSIDRFFYYAYADFSLKSKDSRDKKIIIEEYIDFIKNNNVQANENHLVFAASFIANELEKNQRIADASDILNFSLNRVKEDINKAYLNMRLGVLYYNREDYERAKECYGEVAKAMKNISVDKKAKYLNISIKVMDAFLPFDGAMEWIGEIIKECEKSPLTELNRAKIYLRYAMIMTKEYTDADGMEKYFESAGKLFEKNVRSAPTECLIGIHDALIHSAMLYENKGDMLRAMELYSSDKKILECIGSLYENVDEMLAYNEFLAGIMGKASPSKTFRFLMNSERILTKYIEKTKNYVKFYGKLLFAIVERYYVDGKKIQGVIIARAKLAKLIDAANFNAEYLRDLAYFTRNLARMYDALGYDGLNREFAYMSESYFAIATRAKVNVDSDMLIDIKNRIETLRK